MKLYEREPGESLSVTLENMILSAKGFGPRIYCKVSSKRVIFANQMTTNSDLYAAVKGDGSNFLHGKELENFLKFDQLFADYLIQRKLATCAEEIKKLVRSELVVELRKTINCLGVRNDQSRKILSVVTANAKPKRYQI